MDGSFDFKEMVTRLVKYVIQGLVIAVVAALLPSKSLAASEIVLLALVAASIFSILDLLAPSIAGATRTGAGLGVGLQLVGAL